MKFFIYLLLLIISSPANSEIIEIRGDCVVVDYSAIRNDEGKVKRYTGTTDSVNLGDRVYLEIRLNYTQNPSLVELPSIETRLYKNGMDYALFHNYVQGEWGMFDVMQAQQQIFQRRAHSVEINNDVIGLATRTGDALKLRRYYKNDWSGIYTSSTALAKHGLSAEMVSLNCMRFPDVTPVLNGMKISEEILKRFVLRKSE